MYFLWIGIAAVGMKYFEIGPFTALPWWVTLVPFGLAVLWWWYADASGYTKRREVDKMDKRRDDRLGKQRAAMGMLSAKKKGPKR